MRWAALFATLLMMTSVADPAQAFFKEKIRKVAKKAKKTAKARKMRVMTLNVRIDKTEFKFKKLKKVVKQNDIARFKARLPLIKQVIDHYDPDVLGLQEVMPGSWKHIQQAFGAKYHLQMRNRGATTVSLGNATGQGKEALGLLVKKTRFNSFTPEILKFSQRQRRAAGGCANGNVNVKGNRAALYAKLTDRLTGYTVDVFVTHYPTKTRKSPTKKDTTNCEKEGMSKMLRAAARYRGTNTIILGDLNAGYSSSGSKDKAYELLTLGPRKNDEFFKNTFDVLHDMKKKGLSFKTSEAEQPEKRFGRMIDHVLVAPSFSVLKSKIDRSLFLKEKGKITRVNCAGSRTVVGKNGLRKACKRKRGTDVPIKDLLPYSDHWGLWADIVQKPCKAGTSCHVLPELGQSCRVKEECVPGRCSGNGLKKGKCVCDSDSDCSSGKWCKKGPLSLGTNVCKSKLSDGTLCTSAKQCAGGACNLRCYTPGSKKMGEKCIIQAECGQGRCSGALRGTVSGKCVCDSNGDCSSGKYCKKGPLGIGTNVCATKKSEGKSCSKGSSCKSGCCKFHMGRIKCRPSSKCK